MTVFCGAKEVLEFLFPLFPTCSRQCSTHGGTPVNGSTTTPLPALFYGTVPPVTMTVTFGPRGKSSHGTDGMHCRSPSLWREHNAMVDFFD